jgi:hypothetical protein
MKKVYVMFGEIPEENDSKIVHAFEAVLEGNEVRIIMPTALYTTCSAMARSMELQPYLIQGVISGKDNNGQPILINPTILEKLRFDKEKEIYICDSLEPIVIDSFEDLDDNWKNEDLPGSPRREWTFWEAFKASMFACFQ